MKNKKRNFALLMAATMTAASIAGCSGSNSGKTTETTQATTTSPAESTPDGGGRVAGRIFLSYGGRRKTTILV